MGITGLQGRRIVIAGSRKTDEMSLIIEKQGGIALTRSLQGLTMFEEEQLEEPLRKFATEGADWVILTTGLGSDSIMGAADKLGIGEEVKERLLQARIATRGYKTSAFMKRTGLKATVSDDDGTMQGLMENLSAYGFEGQRVWIQLHGETAPELVRYLQERGAAQVVSVLPYRHVPPEPATLALLMGELTEAAVDTVCFTTAVQVHYLFRHAIQAGNQDQLLEIFDKHVVAAAVGKVTAEALTEYGVKRMVVPDIERMGALIIEIVRYYELHDGATT
ncbi:uroporphyrinogen-III synthase [Paenibacillus endophyticus]|uniref:Uroporphyrinogen-III synthase n=1 Tax=Paenibacillus endophyticus TaxID=1294268 RepID=A0A7W5C8K4_9BACL|nr:uroporphyrinogen-III synthase [Paenibacillus endophyticus]MBB3153110.1 uroporphyrinogen-III synthase [Paenibacillus endophyticus]